jgi:hypothetical protein
VDAVCCYLSCRSLAVLPTLSTDVDRCKDHVMPVQQWMMNQAVSTAAKCPHLWHSCTQQAILPVPHIAVAPPPGPAGTLLSWLRWRWVCVATGWRRVFPARCVQCRGCAVTAVPFWYLDRRALYGACVEGQDCVGCHCQHSYDFCSFWL